MPPRAQSVLKSLIQDEFSNMTAFAKQAGVDQSLVWHDCNGRRISDERFGAYLRVLSPLGKERLLRARLRDSIPEEFQRWVRIVPPADRRESPEPSNFFLLSQEAQASLNRLAGEMVRDAELRQWMQRFIEKAC